MGNKVHKPVVTAAEAETNISTEDFARYQRFFLAGTGGRDVGLKKEEFVSKVWLRQFGGALLGPPFMIALPSPIHHLTLMIIMITMTLLPSSATHPECSVHFTPHAPQICKKLQFLGEKGLLRLFEVCDHSGSQTLTWNEFLIAMYIFDKGTEEQRLRCKAALS